MLFVIPLNAYEKAKKFNAQAKTRRPVSMARLKQNELNKRVQKLGFAIETIPEKSHQQCTRSKTAQREERASDEKRRPMTEQPAKHE